MDFFTFASQNARSEFHAANDVTPGASIIGRFGLKADPIGAHAIWTLNGRDYIAEVRGVYRDESRGCWMLKVRHLNYEPLPDVALSFVRLLNRN